MLALKRKIMRAYRDSLEKTDKRLDMIDALVGTSLCAA